MLAHVAGQSAGINVVAAASACADNEVYCLAGVELLDTLGPGRGTGEQDQQREACSQRVKSHVLLQIFRDR